MQLVASTLHTISEHGVSSITTADAHTSAASSRLNWRPPADLNGLVRLAAKTKSDFFCACAITFQPGSNTLRGIIIITYELLFSCQPVAVVILHVYKILNWFLINICLEGYIRSM